MNTQLTNPNPKHIPHITSRRRGCVIRVVSAEIHGSRVVEGINGMFGKFILTPVWAIRMTSCFVYRD